MSAGLPDSSLSFAKNSTAGLLQGLTPTTECTFIFPKSHTHTQVTGNFQISTQGQRQPSIQSQRQKQFESALLSITFNFHNQSEMRMEFDKF